MRPGRDRKDLARTLEETRKRFGVEKHGIEAVPLLIDTAHRNFGVKLSSPALKRDKDGKDISATFQFSNRLKRLNKYEHHLKFNIFARSQCCANKTTKGFL